MPLTSSHGLREKHRSFPLSLDNDIPSRPLGKDRIRWDSECSHTQSSRVNDGGVALPFHDSRRTTLHREVDIAIQTVAARRPT